MQTKVLLTGIGGFIGSHLLEHILTNTDWNVVGIASWKHKGTPERVEEVLSNHPDWKNRVEIITHDLVSPIPERTQKRIGHVDYILNLAAESHVDRSIDDPVSFIQNNVNLALNTLEFARVAKPKVFVQFSTDEVYGVAPDGVNFPEWSPIIPSNPYSASKACQEAIAISYWRTYSVPVILTNTMNVFGEMQDPEKYVAQLIKKVNTGESVKVHGRPDAIGARHYLHARNCSDAVLYIVNNLPPTMYKEGEELMPDRYNVVGDIELNNLEIANQVAGILGKELHYEFDDFHKTRPGHDRRYALDGTKLKEKGWTAPLDFGESLKRCVNWTLEHTLWL